MPEDTERPRGTSGEAPSFVDFDPAELSDEQLARCMIEAGRRAAARRTIVTTTCRSCGNVLEHTLLTRRYCDQNCQKQARYYRLKADSGDLVAAFFPQLAGKGWQEPRAFTRRQKTTRKGKRS